MLTLLVFNLCGVDNQQINNIITNRFFKSVVNLKTFLPERSLKKAEHHLKGSHSYSNISDFNNASTFPAVGNSHSQFAEPVNATGTEGVIYSSN